ncbi:hypothetical protein Ocin01_07569 [Orchesella cincta]|uniref:Uncharacterized protein n=1 Tax=Orchesella cincta TaxID=48709 RepID=A0A1D2N2I9_ORCCI|nr:hypothetical protein Ocin01_07569 [Orchesella cincta]
MTLRLHFETNFGEMDMETQDLKSEEKGQEILSLIYALHNMKQKSSKSLDYKLKALFASPTEKVIKKANKLLRTVSTEVCPDDCEPLGLRDVEAFKSVLRKFGFGIMDALTHRACKKAIGAIAAFVKNWNSVVESSEEKFAQGYGKIYCSKLCITKLSDITNVFNGLRKQCKNDSFPEALSTFKEEHIIDYVLNSITYYNGATIIAKRKVERELTLNRRSWCVSRN